MWNSERVAVNVVVIDVVPNTTIQKLQLCVRSALAKIIAECNDTWRNELERLNTTYKFRFIAITYFRR